MTEILAFILVGLLGLSVPALVGWELWENRPEDLETPEPAKAHS